MVDTQVYYNYHEALISMLLLYKHVCLSCKDISVRLSKPFHYYCVHSVRVILSKPCDHCVITEHYLNCIYMLETVLGSTPASCACRLSPLTLVTSLLRNYYSIIHVSCIYVSMHRVVLLSLPLFYIVYYAVHVHTMYKHCRCVHVCHSFL